VTVSAFAPSGEPADGVTTLDISLVRRHILNNIVLDSPYKLLAADVDGNSKVHDAPPFLHAAIGAGSYECSAGWAVALRAIELCFQQPCGALGCAHQSNLFRSE
jgi:hypothetical protein